MAIKKDPFDDKEFIQRFEHRRSEHDSVNLSIDEPAILSRVDVLSPKKTLEVGCATGRLTIKLAPLSETLIALDRSAVMIEKARLSLGGTFVDLVCSDFLHYLPDQSFDLIVSAMTAHLVEDFDGFARKAYDLLEVGGHFMFTQRHPCRTANPDGCEVHDGYPSWRVSDYFRDGIREYQWLGIDFSVYHRSIEKILAVLMNAGFSLVELSEPQPPPDMHGGRIVENTNSPAVLLLHMVKR